MTDRNPDVARCLIPIPVGRLEALLGKLTDREASTASRRSALYELHRYVERDLATRTARWTPYYDAALERARDEAELLERHALAPHTIAGFSSVDMAPFMISWSLQQHRSFVELVAGLGCRRLGDAWRRCDASARRLLLGAACDPKRAAERVRRFAIDQLIGTCSAIADAYLNAARRASLGETDWAAVDGPRAAWEREYAALAETHFDDGFHDAMNRIDQFGRREHHLHDLVSLLTDHHLEVADNPFA